MLIVEFCGMPNSGKSTCIMLVKRKLREHQIKTHVIQEGVRNSPILPKGGLEYNLWGVFKLSTRLLEQKNKLKNKAGVILIDRGFNDLRAFSSALVASKLINSKEHKFLYKICEDLSSLVDHYVVFRSSVDYSLKRDKKHSKDKAGMVMNYDFLTKLNRAYSKILMKKTFMAIDSNKMTIEQSASLLLTKILEVSEIY